MWCLFASLLVSQNMDVERNITDRQPYIQKVKMYLLSSYDISMVTLSLQPQKVLLYQNVSVIFYQGKLTNVGQVQNCRLFAVL